MRKLRIFEVIESSTNASLPNSRSWYRNFHEVLEEMGHEVILYPAESGRRAMQQNNAEERTIFTDKMFRTFCEEHRKKPFDLLFAYLMDGMVEPSIIDRIREKTVVTCNFSCNNSHQFYLVDNLSPHFDFSLHSEKDAAAKFKKIGATPVWFPMGANPNYYHPIKVPRIIDVSFVGQCYALRPNYIRHLLENNINVQVYGPGWISKSDKILIRRCIRKLRRSANLVKALVANSPRTRCELSSSIAYNDLKEYLQWQYANHLHGPLSDDDMIRKYSESNISLGFLEVYDNHNPAATVKQHLHLREFEAPMSGALYFTGWCEELAEFYEPDREVVVYRNQHELLDKVRYYLKHPQQAEHIRLAGYRRALSDHTYQRRFELLFRQLNLVGM